jgi:hypothetical protein
MALISVVVLMIAYRRENARRDREYGGGLDGNETSPLSLVEKKRRGLGDKTDTEVIELGDRHPGERCCQISVLFNRSSVVAVGFRYVW